MSQNEIFRPIDLGLSMQPRRSPSAVPRFSLLITLPAAASLPRHWRTIGGRPTDFRTKSVMPIRAQFRRFTEAEIPQRATMASRKRADP